MLHSNWEQFRFQPVLHGAGARATQSHSFHPLTIHSSIRLQTHSHSTDHSLIPQAHAIIPLHIVSSLHILCTPWTMVMSFHAQRHVGCIRFSCNLLPALLGIKDRDIFYVLLQYTRVIGTDTEIMDWHRKLALENNILQPLRTIDRNHSVSLPQTFLACSTSMRSSLAFVALHKSTNNTVRRFRVVSVVIYIYIYVCV